MIIAGRPVSRANKCMGCSVNGSVRSRRLSSAGVYLLMQRQSRLLQFFDGQRGNTVFLLTIDTNELDTGHLYCFELHILNIQICTHTQTSDMERVQKGAIKLSDGVDEVSYSKDLETLS